MNNAALSLVPYLDIAQEDILELAPEPELDVLELLPEPARPPPPLSTPVGSFMQLANAFRLALDLGEAAIAQAEAAGAPADVVNRLRRVALDLRKSL